MDRWIGVASAVMQASYRIVEVQRELSLKAELSFYVPTLVYGHELRVLTERMRS